jgi:hypothetical protein
MAAALVVLAPASAVDADTTPPRLRAVSVEPGLVDIAAEDATVSVNATVTDAGAGVEDCCVSLTFRSP